MLSSIGMGLGSALGAACFAALFGGGAVACAGAAAEGEGAGVSESAASKGSIDDVPLQRIASELEALSGPVLAGREDTFREILDDALSKDAYLCRPSPRRVFGGDVPEGERVITGMMPHYGLFFGPMRYLVRRRGTAWEVEVRIAVEPPLGGTPLELPDCGLAAELAGGLTCRGTPYARSGSTDACPASGVFSAAATPHAVRALLARWSREAEGYWNRDAAAFALPVRYDIDFVIADEAHARALRIDLEVPLSPTCGRTPYFSAMRAGWSLPILAHEVGHVLGLLDEYEALSGIVRCYPKTPFRGAEISRMALSMREDTRLLPLHQYLVLRRFFCPPPASRDPYAEALR